VLFKNKSSELPGLKKGKNFRPAEHQPLQKKSIPWSS